MEGASRRFTTASLGDSALHERRFNDAAAQRLSNPFAVHDQASEVLSKLEELCHEETMAEAKPPVVLVGEAGCGKSAVLATWVKARRGRRHAPGTQPEYVFHHVTGCSRDSTTVPTLLFRIVSELKAFFGLQMAVSTKEQKLSWELMRAVESAARKGRVILVLDGVDRLHSRAFSRFKWLPLHFPANVRVILSTTASTDDVAAVATAGLKPSSVGAALPSVVAASPSSSTTGGGGGGGSGGGRDRRLTDKGLLELARRGCSPIVLHYLPMEARRAVVAAVLGSHVGAAADGGMLTPRRSATEVAPEASQGSYGSYTPVSSMAEDSLVDGSPVRTGDAATDTPSSPPPPPPCRGVLRLTPTQMEAILTAPCAPSPHFLRLLVDCLALAHSHGMDVALLLSSWLCTRSVRSLMERVLKQWTRGWFVVPDADTALTAAAAAPASRDRRSHNPLASPVAGAARGDGPVGSIAPATVQQSVPGLGPALGGALCFVFAARSGLSVEELREVLLAEVAPTSDQAGPGSAEYKVHTPSHDLGSDGMMAQLDAVFQSLGMLHVLGRLHLPPLMRTLRSVVYSRHLKAGMALPRVQHALVAFFNGRPVSVRRAEELPWLLEQVRSWPALKAVLLDLDMFELLWSDRLKSDLLRYWGVLTGALPLSAAAPPAGGDVGDTAALVAAVTSASGAPPSRQAALWMKVNNPLRGARGGGTKPKKKRKHKPKKKRKPRGGGSTPPSGTASPTDTGTVTLWGVATASSVDAPPRMSTTPGRAAAPPRAKPRSSSTTRRRTASTSLASTAAPGAGAGSGGTRGRGLVSKPSVGAMSTVTSSTAAAGLEVTPQLVRSDVVEEYNKAVEVWFSSTSPSFAALQRVLQKIEALMFEFGNIEGATPDFVHCSLDEEGLKELGVTLRSVPGKGGQPATVISLNKSDRGFYYYRRWVWIQFPWMVLNNMDKAVGGAGGDGNASSPSSSQQLAYWKRKTTGVRPTGGDTLMGGTGLDAPSAEQAASRAQRTVDSHVSGLSTVPRRARAASRTSPGRTSSPVGLLNPRDADGRKASMLTPGAAIGKGKAGSVGGGGGSGGGGGGGGGGGAALRPGYHHHADSISHGGINQTAHLDTAHAPLPFSAHKGQLRSRPAHASECPIDNREAKVVVEHSRLEQLRKLHDRMVFQIAARERDLEDLERKVHERDVVDRRNQEELDKADADIFALERKLARLAAVTARTEREGAFLQRVLGLTERNPPNDTAHMARIDKVLNAVKMELEEVATVEKVVDFELRRLTTQELPKLKAEIERSDQYRADILDRLAQQRLEQHAAAAQPLHSGTSSSPPRPPRAKARAPAAPRSPSRLSVAGGGGGRDGDGPAAVDDPAVLMRYLEAFRRIQAATGVRDVDQLHDAFVNRDAAVAALQEQRAQYEAQLGRLKEEHDTLTEELAALEYTGEEFTSRDIRQLEEANAAAEADLHRSREKHAFVASVLKDVKAGALHLANLLGFTFADTAAFVHATRAAGNTDALSSTGRQPPAVVTGALPVAATARGGGDATVADDDIELVLKMCSNRAAALLAAMAGRDEDFTARGGPDTARTGAGTERSRPRSAKPARPTTPPSSTAPDSARTSESPSLPQSLTVLGLRATPRGTHLRTIDLAKTSSPAAVHVLSDKKRLAEEVSGGVESDSDGDTVAAEVTVSAATGGPLEPRRRKPGTALALHPRMQGYSAVELHAYIGKGLGVSTRPPSAHAADPSLAREQPSAKTMVAVRDPANHVVNRRQWKQLAAAVKRRGRRTVAAGGDESN